jgi:hypothetical protein
VSTTTKKSCLSSKKAFEKLIKKKIAKTNEIFGKKKFINDFNLAFYG